MFNNNQQIIKLKDKKKKLNFNFVFKQLLSISKDSPTHNKFYLLKTFVPNSKDKDKFFSNKTC